MARRKQKMRNDKVTIVDQDEVAETVPKGEFHDSEQLPDTDKLLDKIDEILEDEERRSFVDKIKSINFIARRSRNPCDDAIRLPAHFAEPLFEAGILREAPECADC